MNMNKEILLELLHLIRSRQAEALKVSGYSTDSSYFLGMAEAYQRDATTIDAMLEIFNSENGDK